MFGSEYTLSNSHTLSAEVPVKRGFTFKGWASTPESTDIITEVSLSDSDVTVYAIWEENDAAVPFTYDFSSDERGIADGVITVMCTDDAFYHTYAELYFATADGIMEEYTPFAELSLPYGAASYTVSGSRCFPKGATHICVLFKGDGLEDVSKLYSIPENKIQSSDTPLFSFYAISDTHIEKNGDSYDYITKNRANAVKDIQENKSNIDFVIVNGDLVDYGYDAAFFENQKSFLKESFTDNGIAAFTTVGNHEFFGSDNLMSGV